MKKLYPCLILLSFLFTSAGCQKETQADIEQSLVGSWEIRHVSGGMNPDRSSNPGNGNILQFTGTDYAYIAGAKATAYKGTYCILASGSGRDKEYTLSFVDGVINTECGEDTPKVFKIEGDKLTISTGSIAFDGTIEIYERVEDPVLETN